MDAAVLFEENYDSLCRYLLRFTGDSDAAADAAQEAFVKLLERGSEAQNARAWLFTVATNVALEAGRTRTRRLRLLAAGVERAPHGDPMPAGDALVEAEARRTRVQRALLSLSEKERQVLLMREEGFAQREIAEAVGTTTGSVGTLIARALEKLTRVLDAEQEDL
jgi:RNA polymerase sigma-70 factor (ECF subfamily)